MAQISAVCYGKNAVPAHGGGDPSSRLAPPGAVLMPGAAGPMAHCAAIKSDGEQCGARPANGTEFCAGHLRSQGRI